MGNKESSNVKNSDEDKLKNLKLFKNKDNLFKKGNISSLGQSFANSGNHENSKKKIVRSSIHLEKLLNIGKEISNQIISITINSDINLNILSSAIVPDLTNIPDYQGEAEIVENYKNINLNYNYLRGEKSVLNLKNIEGFLSFNRKYFESETKSKNKDRSFSGIYKNNKSLNKSVDVIKNEKSKSNSKDKSLNPKSRINKSQDAINKKAENDKFNKRLLYIKPMKIIKKPKESEFNITVNTINSKNKANQTITVVHKLDQSKLKEYYARKNKKQKKKRKLDMTFS